MLLEGCTSAISSFATPASMQPQSECQHGSLWSIALRTSTAVCCLLARSVLSAAAVVCVVLSWLQVQEQRRAFWTLQEKMQRADDKANRTYAEV